MRRGEFSNDDDDNGYDRLVSYRFQSRAVLVVAHSPSPLPSCGGWLGEPCVDRIAPMCHSSSSSKRYVIGEAASPTPTMYQPTMTANPPCFGESSPGRYGGKEGERSGAPHTETAQHSTTAMSVVVWMTTKRL